MSRSFDGVDDILTCGSLPVVNGLSALTIAAWTYADTDGESNRGAILNKSGGGVRGWRFIRASTSRLSFVVDCTTNGFTVTTTHNLATSATWIHSAVTWDGSIISTTGVNIYVNAVSSPGYSVSNTGRGTRIIDDGDPIEIGNVTTFAFTFSGKIASVHLYNRVLARDELRQLMHFPGSISQGLVGFWPLWGLTPEMNLSTIPLHGTNTSSSVSFENPPVNQMFILPNHCSAS